MFLFCVYAFYTSNVIRFIKSLMFRSTYSTITQHDCLKGSTQVIISLVLSGRAMVQAVWLLLLVSNLLIHECFSHYLLLTESSDLNNSLCGSNDGSVLPAGTQLLLSTDVHHILSSSSFCLVINTSNITIRSVSSITSCNYYLQSKP